MVILVSEDLLIKKEVIIMAITIQVKDLQQGYGKTIVLKDINLNVHNGEILGLIGPSGAGKTTLVSAIMGMLTPQKKEPLPFWGNKCPIENYWLRLATWRKLMRFTVP